MTQEATANAKSPGFSCKILIIDDDPMVVKILMRKLIGAGFDRFEFDTVGTYDEGWRRIQEGIHDIYLVDVKLGAHSGIDLISQARSAFIKAPFIVLTGSENPELDSQAMEAGANDFLNKDQFDGILLERTIRYVLENSRNEREVREVNQQLRQIQDRMIQSEKLESIGRMAAGIAHDLRNPLGLIRLAYGFLHNKIGEDQGNVGYALEELGEGLKRAEHIAEELLDLSSPRKLNPTPQSIKSIVSSTLVFVHYALTKDGVNYSVNMPESDPEVLVERNKIVQVLINLIENARHAMPEGGSLELRITETDLHQIDDMPRQTLESLNQGDAVQRVVVLEIKDSGTGIPPDKLEEVYTPFFTTKPKGVGTGLGLDIVRNIMHNHGAEIQLRNNPEGGACAILVFPVRGETS